MSEFVEKPIVCKEKSHRRLIYSVGINDADYIVSYNDGNKIVKCQYYERWYKILTRCYSEKYHKKQPTYKDCIICDEWKLFSNFMKWMKKQEWKEKAIDKDIIIKDNKIYSPETCCFIQQNINNILLDNKKTRGKYPAGVHFDKTSNKFMAKAVINGTRTTIGRFLTSKEASNAYKKAKHKEILRVADLQSDDRVRDGLYRHAGLILI